MATKKPNKDALSLNVYNGQVTVYHLPQDVYFYNSERLMSAVNKSFPKVKFKYGSPDYKLYSAIHDNIYMFSGAKTFWQTLDMSNELIKGGNLVPYEDFSVKADAIFDQYNENWLRTEYETAKDAARLASKWVDFERNKKANPYLTYVTEGDETVCEICGPFDGISAPVDDPIWNKIAVPQHFNCHCDIEAHDDPDDVSDKSEIDEAFDTWNGAKELKFKNNVGKTGQVFSNKHPYFTIPKQYRKLAMDNFGLPIPKLNG